MSNPRIQLRHDTAENWSTANPVLLAGEVGIEQGSSFDANVVLEFPNVATISNNGIMTMSTKPTGLTNEQLNYAIHTTTPVSNRAGRYFDCKFRVKPTDNTNEYATIFRQYLAQSENDYYWDMALSLHYSNNELSFSYNNWTMNVACQLPSDYLNKYYTYRVCMLYPDNIPHVEVIDDKDTVVSSAYSQGQMGFHSPSSLEGKYTVIGSSYDNWFTGEMDLNNCSMWYETSDGSWTWTGGTAGKSTKLKIGDGETAWNDLPYIV